MVATSKLGSLLQRLRKEKNLTQGQLAEASGLSRVQIARLETGKRGGGLVGWETMTGLARAFGVPPEEMASMITKEPPIESSGSRPRGRPRKAANEKPAAKRKKR